MRSNEKMFSRSSRHKESGTLHRYCWHLARYVEKRFEAPKEACIRDQRKRREKMQTLEILLARLKFSHNFNYFLMTKGIVVTVRIIDSPAMSFHDLQKDFATLIKSIAHWTLVILFCFLNIILLFISDKHSIFLFLKWRQHADFLFLNSIFTHCYTKGDHGLRRSLKDYCSKWHAQR